MSELYLCYDLKGIQSFIFSVPRLRHICGGSALIDQFDHETVRETSIPGADLLFTGGGKGAFRCAGKESADRVQEELVRKAHEVGLSICLGRHEDFSEASHLTDRSYPYLPKGSELTGHPCEASGLFPVADGGVHWTIQKREWQRGERMNRWFENQLLTEIKLPLLFDPDKCLFVHDASPESDFADGTCGYEALGGRNRWAVISMDGNDMGSQHRVASEKWGGDSVKLLKWLREMSDGVDSCSRGACKAAIERILKEWAGSESGANELAKAKETDGTTWLPIRPLIVGGDDLVVICHVRHAMSFVQEASRRFTELSIDLAEQAKAKGIDNLWPATGGQLTISAGVLFTPVSLPLASAISYSEALMASAKGRGRKMAVAGKPSPACVDWESVTEGVLDNPADRRGREFRFLDEDIHEVVTLTRRPYAMEELEKLDQMMDRYEKVPATIRHQVLPGLRTGYWDRQKFVARLGKHQGALTADLKESENLARAPSGGWQQDSDVEIRGRTCKSRSTAVVDALLLLEERGRMERRTCEKETI